MPDVILFITSDSLSIVNQVHDPQRTVRQHAQAPPTFEPEAEDALAATDTVPSQ